MYASTRSSRPTPDTIQAGSSTGPRQDPAAVPAGQQVISASHTDRKTTLLVRASEPVLDPAWTVSEVSLEDMVLAYMRHAPRDAGRRSRDNQLEAQK